MEFLENSKSYRTSAFVRPTPVPSQPVYDARSQISRLQVSILLSSRSSLPSACRPHDRNYTWAELMKRVWELDVLECPRCLGRMKIVAAIHAPDSITKILNSLGLPSRAPPVAPACRDSQTGFDDF